MAAFGAAGLVLLDGLRGILMGWPQTGFLILMAGLSGLGMVLLIPAVAAAGATAMVRTNAMVVLGTFAVVVSLLAARQGCALSVTGFPEHWRAIVGRLGHFAGMQFAGFGGIAVSSWFLAAMVTRSDPSLHEMAFYGVAAQVRLLVLALPGLLAQAIYPSLTVLRGEDGDEREGLTVSGTILTTVPVLVIGGLVLGALPFGVSLAYGQSYLAAETVCATMVISGIVHMGGIVPRNRLSIVAVGRLATVNAGWTALVFVGAVFIVPAGGALGAAAVLVAADIVSYVLALRLLGLQGECDRALANVSMTTFITVLVLALVWIVPFGGGAGARALLSLAVAMVGAVRVWGLDRPSCGNRGPRG
jgi:hypothetical protein